MHLYHTPDISVLLIHGCKLAPMCAGLFYGVPMRSRWFKDDTLRFGLCSQRRQRASLSVPSVDHLHHNATLLKIDNSNPQAKMNDSLFIALCAHVLHDFIHDIKGMTVALRVIVCGCWFRQAKFESTQMQQQWVSDFAKKWDAYDWTKQLGWSYVDHQRCWLQADLLELIWLSVWNAERECVSCNDMWPGVSCRTFKGTSTVASISIFGQLRPHQLQKRISRLLSSVSQ